MKLKHIFPAAMMACVAAGFASCDGTKEATYEPAPATSADKVVFEATEQTVEIAADQTKIPVMLYRPAEESEADKTVHLVTTYPDANGVSLHEAFEVPETATFEAGFGETVVYVTVAPEALELNKPYMLTIGVDSNDANAYAVGAVTSIKVIKSTFSDWTVMGTGTYTFAQYFEGDEPVQVLSRYDTTAPDVIEYQFQWDDGAGNWETFMRCESADGGKTVSVPEQDFVWNSNYEEYVQVADMFTYTGKDDYKPLSFYDPDTRKFTLALVYYISLGVFANGYEYLQLD